MAGLFKSASQLEDILQTLFDRIAVDEAAIRSMSQSKLILKLEITQPAAVVLINGRKNPVHVSYGAENLRPDLNIRMNADTLHKILLRELRLSQALASGQLKVQGPVWKSFVFEDIFHRAQEFYPQVMQEKGWGNR